MKTSSGQSGLWWVIGAIVVMVVGIGALKWNQQKILSRRTNREVALACTSDMATQFHIHPNLAIHINGSPIEIPAQIGIRAGCMNAIHTHDATGVLHVEAPEKRDFTLADFFAVWGESFSKQQVLDRVVDGTHRIRMTVSSTESEDYERLVLKDNDHIVISYEEVKS